MQQNKFKKSKLFASQTNLPAVRFCHGSAIWYLYCTAAVYLPFPPPESSLPGPHPPDWALGLTWSGPERQTWRRRVQPDLPGIQSHALTLARCLSYRFPRLSLHPSGDLHVHDQASPVLLSGNHAGETSLCHSLSRRPPEWLRGGSPS